MSALELAADDVLTLEPTPGKVRSPGRAALASIEGRTGLSIGALTLLLIIIGPFVAPYPPDDVGAGIPLQGPSYAHLLGTDQLGRDVFSRFLSGGLTVLFVPLAAVVVAYIVGGALGLLAAYKGRRVDILIARSFDLLLTFPPLLLVLVLISGLGSSRVVLVLTVALVFLPRIGRVVRGGAQGVTTSEYVAAAQARGEHTAFIVFREILPNIASPVIADFALRLTYGIIFISGLNYLGLGAQPPSPDWGLMVAESQSFITVAPAATLAPIIGIACISIGFNLLADALSAQLTGDTKAELGAV